MEGYSHSKNPTKLRWQAILSYITYDVITGRECPCGRIEAPSKNLNAQRQCLAEKLYIVMQYFEWNPQISYARALNLGHGGTLTALFWFYCIHRWVNFLTRCIHFSITQTGLITQFLSCRKTRQKLWFYGIWIPWNKWEERWEKILSESY